MFIVTEYAALKCLQFVHIYWINIDGFSSHDSEGAENNHNSQ